MTTNTLIIIIASVLLSIAAITTGIAGYHYIADGMTPMVERLLQVTGILGVVAFIVVCAGQTQ